MRTLKLRITGGPQTGFCFATEKDRVTVGRLPSNDICLEEDTGVSSHHAQLSWCGDRWILEDAGSKNGTFIESGHGIVRIDAPISLSTGQTILIGMSRLVVSLEPLIGSGPNVPTKITPTANKRVPTKQLPTQEHRVDRLYVRTLESLHLPAQPESSTLWYEYLTNTPLGSSHKMRYLRNDVEAISRQLAVMARASFHSLSPRYATAQDQSWNDLLEIGTALSRQLLPRTLTKRLRESAAGGLLLSLSSDLIAVPWELMKIDDELLCLRYSLGRQVLTHSSLSSGLLTKRTNREKLNVLLICNPTQDLPEAQAAGESVLAMLESLDSSLSVEFVSGSRVQRSDVMTRLGKADIVYYNGHADYDAREPSESGWRLKEGRVTCADFHTLSEAPLLVFANGCETGREAEWSSEISAETTAYGLASAFLLAGVSSYIGSIWPIPDASSALFAKSFFATLTQGLSVGESVRQARRDLIEMLGPSDLVWASYVYYGDPVQGFPQLVRH